MWHTYQSSGSFSRESSAPSVSVLETVQSPDNVLSCEMLLFIGNSRGATCGRTEVDIEVASRSTLSSWTPWLSLGVEVRGWAAVTSGTGRGVPFPMAGAGTSGHDRARGHGNLGTKGWRSGCITLGGSGTSVRGRDRFVVAARVPAPDAGADVEGPVATWL